MTAEIALLLFPNANRDETVTIASLDFARSHYHEFMIGFSIQAIFANPKYMMQTIDWE
jgi:hypothetical protein